MNILAGGIKISANFIHEAEFKNLANYETKEEPDFILNSTKEVPHFTKMNKTFQTEYYTLYETERGTFQVQRYDTLVVGGILYEDKTVTMYLANDSFQSEYLMSQYAFVYWIRNYTNGIFIHSSSIMVNDKGFLICAKSGTGKSTHRRLWERHGAVCINDDKNVISYEDGKLYILPNPWSGKHFCDNNFKVELKAIVFIYQNKENTCEDVSPDRALALLLKQIQLPSDKYKDNWNMVVDKMLELKLVKYGCNMEDSAYLTLEKNIGGFLK